MNWWRYDYRSPIELPCRQSATQFTPDKEDSNSMSVTASVNVRNNFQQFNLPFLFCDKYLCVKDAWARINSFTEKCLKVCNRVRKLTLALQENDLQHKIRDYENKFAHQIVTLRSYAQPFVVDAINFIKITRAR